MRIIESRFTRQAKDSDDAGDYAEAAAQGNGGHCSGATELDADLLVRVVNSVKEDHGDASVTPPETRAAMACEYLEDLLAWRGRLRVDTILDEDIPFTREFHKSWPVTVHGCDAFGHPIVAERIEDIAAEGLSGHMDKETVLRHRIQIMEAVAHLKRRESRRRGHSLHRHIWVIDLAGLKVAHFTGDVRDFVLDLVRLCTDKYTDTLFAMWLVNAPVVFRAVWCVVSRLLKRTTKEKIRIVGGSDVGKVRGELAAMGMECDAMPTFVPGGCHAGTPAATLIREVRREREAKN